MLVLPALGAVNSIYHARVLRNYVRRTQIIQDVQGLAEFQKIVARQMLAALVQLVLVVVPLVLYFVGILTQVFRFKDIAFVIIPGVILMALGYVFKKVETKACRIPAANEDLDEQRLAVISTWRKKPLPDW
jgi:hypothetical protein